MSGRRIEEGKKVRMTFVPMEWSKEEEEEERGKTIEELGAGGRATYVRKRVVTQGDFWNAQAVYNLAIHHTQCLLPKRRRAKG